MDDLWFLLHHADDQDHRLVFGLSCYMDDSGSDDGSPMVTCGAVVMDRGNFNQFSRRWARMYQRSRFNSYPGYLLEQPLHMSDFVCMGRYAGLLPEYRRAFFSDAVKLINEHKFYSVSVATSQRYFQEELSAEVRRALVGPYALAFFSIALLNQQVSKISNQGPFRISYLVDSGFGHFDQLKNLHSMLVAFEQGMNEFRQVGALGTDTDDRVPVLQAADLVAWASRNVALKRGLSDGFEPLMGVLQDIEYPPHVTIELPRDAIRMLSKPINKWISETGSLPTLADFMVRSIPGAGFAVKLKS